MSEGPPKVLITSMPGVGKTTLIKRVCDALADLHPVGFYTEEIRSGGIRQGFSMVGLDGTRGILAHVDCRSPHKIGKYGVDISAFEAFLDTIDILAKANGIVIIDEIGKMECLSSKFTRLVLDLLETKNRFLATIAARGGGFISDIRQRSDVALFELTLRNRNNALAEILGLLGLPRR